VAWAPNYASEAELAAYLRIGDSDDDVELALANTSASRAIDRATNRQFGVVAAVEERLYTARYDSRRRRWVIEVDDFMTTTGLVVETADGTVDLVDAKPANAAALGRPWTLLVVDPEAAVLPTCAEDAVTATALWGWTAVPDTIKNAQLLQASRFFTRRNAPFGVAGSPESGSEMRLLAKVDPDVAVMIGTYRRWWAAK
jgi:hypothetical protein